MHDSNQPVTPGAIIGYRANGAAIRLIGGGSEPLPPADPTPPPADPAPAPAAPTPAAPAQAGDPATPPSPPAAADSIDQLPGWAQKVIRDTRSEAAANRTKAKEHSDALTALQASQQEKQEKLDGIAEALGLKSEEATPEQIAAERDAERGKAEDNAARARAAAVELAVFRAASAMNVNGNALLDSRSFVTGLDGLDPSAEGFADQVIAKISAAADTNPGWKVTPAAAAEPVTPPPLQPPAVPASGPQGSFTAAPAGPRQLTVEETHGMTPGQVQEVINKGLLVDAGFGPKRASRR